MATRFLQIEVPGDDADTEVIWPSDGVSVMARFVFRLGGTSGGRLEIYDADETSKASFVKTDTGSSPVLDMPLVSGRLAVLSDITDTAYAEKTATYAITPADGTINCTANSFTVTLPTAVGITGQIFTIKNTGSGTITVATTSSELVDGGSAPNLAQWDSLDVQSTGAGYIII